MPLATLLALREDKGSKKKGGDEPRGLVADRGDEASPGKSFFFGSFIFLLPTLAPRFFRFHPLAAFC